MGSGLYEGTKLGHCNAPFKIKNCGAFYSKLILNQLLLRKSQFFYMKL